MSLPVNMVAEPRLRVRYAETDKMGVVYHSNFIVWFEVGRVELLRQAGFNYRDMEIEDDCHLAVVDVRCRYKSPAYYDDELIVRTRLKHLRGSLLQFSYEVVRVSDQVLLAEAETTHLVVNAKFEKTTLPEKYVSAFNAAIGQEQIK
ncbi:MAG: 4-hydroxybenzoyl-CoA thioesterase [Acidobacteriales bacterium]|nr:4-hydroxybenzoyl-CoA thioesterase [Terriglobales bacterium]